MDDHEAEQKLKEIREKRKEIRRRNARRRYRKSKLQPYRAELVRLRRSGATLGDLQVYLKEKGKSIHRSTIFRQLRKWPESPDHRG
jgi:hypothetical protein